MRVWEKRERERDTRREKRVCGCSTSDGRNGREVQSELEWFTEDEACSESVLFRVIPEKKDQTAVRPPAQSSLFGPLRPRRTFNAQKNQQQPQRIFSNRALRWPISAATLTIDVNRRERKEKRRTSTRRT